MGIAETIPGISGSTIALFLGIYEKLILTLNNFLPNNLLKIIKAKNNDRKKLIKKLNISFITFLMIGMVLSVFTFSHIMSYLFEFHKLALLTFFIGFILSSSIISGKKYFKKQNIIPIGLGFLFGISLLLLSPKDLLSTSPISILISGIITITFGLLPGVSGSFMLLIIGKYEYILHAVKDFNLPTIFFFALGMIIGILIFIKLIKHILENHKSNLFSFFFAFILGSITILIKDAYNVFFINEILIVILYLIVGTLCGICINKYFKEN